MELVKSIDVALGEPRGAGANITAAAHSIPFFLFISALPNELNEEKKRIDGHCRISGIALLFGLPFLWVGYGRLAANGSAQREDERSQTNNKGMTQPFSLFSIWLAWRAIKLREKKRNEQNQSTLFSSWVALPSSSFICGWVGQQMNGMKKISWFVYCCGLWLGPSPLAAAAFPSGRQSLPSVQLPRPP